MARRIPWRRLCPDTVTERIEQASQARIYLLRETGPTGFLLKEDGIDRKFKVFLGDQHSCTCQTFSRERELCIHIIWVLLKKFRVPKENPIIFQLSLVEREINEVMRGCYTRSSRVSRKNSEKVVATDNREKLKQKEIEDNDVCPICQDEFTQQPEPLTYCKYGCGNSVHIKCMKVWAEHQRSTGEAIVKCPLCRVDFGTFQELMDEFHKSSRRKTRAERQHLHLGATCKRCRACPISGKCYRCVVCADYHLCHTCFATDTHVQHSFQFRQKLSDRWRPASRSTMLPNAVINNLQNRDITEGDYDLLLQLDRQVTEQDGIPTNVIQNLPTEVLQETHRLLMESSTCGICLLNFHRYQCVRTLPCHHSFHLSCIDGWLLNHAQCPVDGSYIGSVIASAHAQLNARMLPDNGEVSTGSNGNQSVAGRTTVGKRMSHKSKLSGRSAADSAASLPSSFTLSGSGLLSKLTRTPERETNAVEPPLLDGQHALLRHNPSLVPQQARYGLPVNRAGSGQRLTSTGTSAGINEFMRHNLTFNPVNSKPPISPHSVTNFRSSSGDSKRPATKLRERIARMSLNNSQRSSSEGDLSLLATGTAVQRRSPQTSDSDINVSRTPKAGRLVKGQPTSQKSRQSFCDPGLALNSEPIIASGISVCLPPVD